ncbi:MBL fold metallo-hydrolase [Clostridium estertheticum]|uniref:MBL fold metallo-hydrolase n=1 Tax=Clostridium estertheticum TaxID=238834 RepID=UPI0013E91856|nr:MBL fold metallo-hydrolase [Clostridium estertheticum]MBZ9687360.1 MBL fold metallo-hydrolase [Clostridium estertheticum]
MFFKPIKTKRLTEDIYVVKTIISNFYIYTDGENTLCFDTGYIPIIIKRALKKINITPDSISHIFLTHSDYDHVGGIKLFKNAQVYLSLDEEKMITFKKPRVLLLFNKRIKRKYEMLKDGDITYIGKIKVKSITTPGHTPGSMSYLVNDSILFSGDTLTIRNSKVKPFFWLQNMNTRLQKESIKKLLKIDTIKLICTGHTGYLKI